MNRFIQWAMFLVCGLTLLMVAAVFAWENAMNILALIIMFCLSAVISGQAKDLGILE